MPRRKPLPPALPSERGDDWASSTSSLGGVRDKHRGITFTRRRRLNRVQLEALYEQQPIVAFVVDQIVDDAFRPGWTFKSITTRDGSSIDPEVVQSDLDALDVDGALMQAAKWSRLYGGALVVEPWLDSGAPEEPLCITADSSPLRLQVIPAERALPLYQDVGLFSPTFGKVLHYQINGLADAPVTVDHTRCIPFEPIKLPFEAQQRGERGANGWGPSIIERFFDALGRDGAAASHAVSMLYVASILFAKLKGYRAEHATKEGKARVRAILASMREALDSFGVLGMDKDDELGNLQLTISNAGEIMDRTEARLAAACREYPKEILFKEITAGLNAGELSGPQEIYFGGVESWWNREIKPALDQILAHYFRWKGLDVASWELELLPLWTRSDTADADIHAKNAAADATYIDKGCITADEVREHRFVRGNAGQIVLEQSESSAEPLDLDPADVAAHEEAAGELAHDPLNGPSDDPIPLDAVSPQEAAAKFRVHTRTITRMMETNAIRYWGLGAHKRVSLADIAKAARAHEATPVPAADALLVRSERAAIAAYLDDLAFIRRLD